MSTESALVRPDRECGKVGEASQRLWSLLAAQNVPISKVRHEGLTEETKDPADTFTLSLPGRCLLGDGGEFPCQATDVSPIGIGIRGLCGGHLGEWAIAHIRSVGVIEGVIVRRSPVYFVVDIRATPAWVERLSVRIGWVIRRGTEYLPDRRAHERVDLGRRRAALETSDGRAHSCEMLDVSAGGAALHLGNAALYFWVDQQVTLDKRPAHVLRHFPGGIVVKFDEPMEGDPALSFSRN